jgi:hypothetical protein
MAEEQQQQQQQQRPLDRGVLDGIARLKDPRYRAESHKLWIDGYSRRVAPQPPIDRRGLEHLVDFLDSNNGGDEVIITELVLDHVQLSEPSDGGFGSITYLCLPGATRR